LNRRQETVPAAGNRLNENGIIRGVPKYFTQTLDGSVQACIEIDKGVVPPDVVSQILSGDDLAGIFQERYEEPEWLLLQLHPVPVFQEFAGGGIHLEGAEPKERTERRLHIAPNARAFGPSVVHRDGSLRPISSYLIRDDLVVHRGIYDKFL